MPAGAEGFLTETQTQATQVLRWGRARLFVVVGMNTCSDSEYWLIFISLPDETSTRCTELAVSVGVYCSTARSTPINIVILHSLAALPSAPSFRRVRLLWTTSCSHPWPCH
jgi:hypothetical protein